MTENKKNVSEPASPVSEQKEETVSPSSQQTSAPLPSKKSSLKIVVLIVILIGLGAGTAAGVYFWQENQKTQMQQELDRTKKEKADADKNKQYLIDKAEKEAARAEALRKLQEDSLPENSNINTVQENENQNINMNESIALPDDADDIIPKTMITEDTTPIAIEEDEDIAPLQEEETTTVGDGFEIPKNTPIGYIKKLYEKDGKHYMDIDYIQWFVGEDAEPEIRKDGKCDEWGEGDGSCYPMGGFYIRNVNPKIRTFEIAADAEVHMTTYPPSTDGENFGGSISYTEFKKIFTSDSDYSYLKDEPYYIIIDHDKIIIIAEQFIP